ncbi:MAG: 50S ribosome-binding GTPase, partial [Caulobacteraceae bacterium]|nr:50S ribosome-binding GTPase [Caulobacteraceae bacterium]
PTPPPGPLAPDADRLTLEQAGLMGGGSPPPASPPPPEPPAVEAVAERAPDPAPDPEPEIIEDADDGDVKSSTLRSMRENGDFVVALLGYPTAGKTWFLNRLKKFCVGDRYSVVPPPARPGQMVNGTDHIEDHYFANTGGKFVVIDIPGERFERAVQNRFATEPRLLEVVQTCQALIVVLPTDEVLLSGRAAARVGAPSREEIKPEADALRRALPAQDAAVKRARAALTRAQKEAALSRGDPAMKKAAQAAQKKLDALEAELDRSLQRQSLLEMADAGLRLETFIEGIGSLAAIASMLDSGKSPRELARIGHREIAAHFVSPEFKAWRAAKPVFGALTKADLALAMDDATRALVDETDPREVDLMVHFDRDPLETIRHFRPELANQFQEWFGWSKFDFVTAFGGHDGSRVIQYEGRDHHGVWAVIDWILWAKDVHHWTPSHWKPVRAAQWLRGLRDGPRAARRPGYGGDRRA